MSLKSALRWGTLLALGLALIFGTYWAVRSYGHYQSLRSRLDSLEALTGLDPSSIDIEDMEALVLGLHSDIANLHADAKPFLWLLPHLGWLPRYGGDVQNAPHLLTMAVELSEIGVKLAPAFLPLLEERDQPMALMEQIILELDRSRDTLQDAGDHMRAAIQARAAIQEQSLSPMLQGWLKRLDPLLPLGEMAVKGGLLAPGLLGADGARTYLVVAQNDDELRPTGGFITAVGEVVVENGRLVSLSFRDSYAVDDLGKYYPDPPQPLFDYMSAEQWLFRDSNWSPDYPTAARQMAHFYAYGTGNAVDGVIAIDMVALQRMVQALEPVSVPGLNEPIGGDNVMAWMRQARGGFEGGGDFTEWWQGRKDFIGALAEGLMARLESGDVDWIPLARSMYDALLEKHILVYSTDEEAMEMLSELGWDGAVLQPEGDYVYVVDSNIGFNKVNPSIRQAIEYQVTIAEDLNVHGRLKITYENTSSGEASDCDISPRYGPSYEENMQRCYWDYVRILIPEGSGLAEASQAPLPAESLRNKRRGGAGEDTFIREMPEFGKEVFGMFVFVPRGESRDYFLEYQLPAGVLQREGEAWVYGLTVQKQPGRGEIPVSVRIRLPSGMMLIESSHTYESLGANEFAFLIALKEDIRLEIRFQ